ncbi:MAG TPA: R3H domain-containing nucleic acid-binding protein [Candidatus Saccharimonadales bacterium]|nr:R3H domain-containing nucleic acid-binding protein [Candidatus Saccharimonadales bacterium]
MHSDTTPKGDIDSDAMQGSGEERTEAYQAYDGGAPEPITQQGAESDGRQARTVNDSLEEAIVFGKKYLEDLLSFFGLNTDVHATSDDEVIQLNVPSTHLNGFLIGQRGENMRSLQYLVSTALKNNGYTHTRANVDIAEYKKQRADRLRERAEEWVKRVKESGEPMDLQPMNAADRRVVHQLAAEHGLSSDSDGEGRDRHIVLKPASEQP